MWTGARVGAVARRNGALVLETARGPVEARFLINCAGLQSDRVARMCGVEPGVTIVPFRGEYYEVIPGRQSLVRNLVYPVPDPRFPFLGVHFTRMIKGGVECGPNAVLAFRREGYGRTSFSARDSAEMFRYPGFWRMASKYWPMATAEMYRSFSKRAFVHALQGLVPELRDEDVHRGGSGVRAQALDPGGTAAGRLPHRRGRADGARAQRPVPGRDRLHQHRPVDRGHGPAVLPLIPSGGFSLSARGRPQDPKFLPKAFSGFRFRIGLFPGPPTYNLSEEEDRYA